MIAGVGFSTILRAFRSQNFEKILINSSGAMKITPNIRNLLNKLKIPITNLVAELEKL
jgi:hypothetical protein